MWFLLFLQPDWTIYFIPCWLGLFFNCHILVGLKISKKFFWLPIWMSQRLDYLVAVRDSLFPRLGVCPIVPVCKCISSICLHHVTQCFIGWALSSGGREPHMCQYWVVKILTDHQTNVPSQSTTQCLFNDPHIENRLISQRPQNLINLSHQFMNSASTTDPGGIVASQCPFSATLVKAWSLQVREIHSKMESFPSSSS